MRPALVVAVAAALVVAGCAGTSDTTPTAATTDAPSPTTTTAAPAPTPTSASDAATTTPSNGSGDGTGNDSGPALGIDVMNGPLPYDSNVTFARVQSLLGTNVSPPGAVMVLEGIDAAGQASNTGRVYVDTTDEAVLAHEFVHSILLRAYPQPATGSPDAAFAANSLVEGAAEYVEAAYERRYLDAEPSYFRRLPGDPGEAYYLGRYYFGYRYFDARADSPAEVPGLHDPPPNTSEQVLHGLAPSAEPPRDLVVSVDDRHLASDAEWGYAGSDRLGEITAFLTLRTRLPVRTAETGAGGWGNDRLLTLEGDGGTGFVWIHRWDDPANATEFADAAREFVDAPAPTGPPPTEERRTPNRAFTDRVWTGSDASYEVRRLAPETTAVVVGPDAFVAAAEVSGGNETVSVGVGG